MYHHPKRMRAANSGACSHCITHKKRCYIGCKGIPCSSCRRFGLICDGRASPEAHFEKPRPPLRYCEESQFVSQIQNNQPKKAPRERLIPAVSTTCPLDNYISIANQLLGSELQYAAISVKIPGYVSGLPTRLDSEDLDYLECKGALWLPSARFRTELLKSYIEWVHPQVPVLDLDVFLCTIAENDSENSISLLLFHAAMFAASAFVDIVHIRNEGYASRKAAREVLFRRAKVLVELDCEDDRLSTVQALLLLIHWHDTHDVDKEVSHWIGICLSLAMSIGLNRSPVDTGMTLSQQRCWRRTWWSVFNHARLTAEGLLNMMTIESEQGNGDSSGTTMIALDDFKFGVFSPEARAVVKDCDVLRVVECQMAQAFIFIEKTRICRMSQFSSFSSHVCRVLHGIEGRGIEGRAEKVIGNPDKAESLHLLLCQLPSIVEHQYPVALNPTQWDRSIYLHRAWLRLLHLGSAYADLRDELQLAGEVFVDPKLNGHSSLMSQCLLDMTDVFEEVNSLNLSSQLPSPSTVLLVLVLTFHRREVNTGMQHTQALSARKLHICWSVMDQLREASEQANHVISLVNEGGSSDLWERLSSALLWQ